MLYGLSSVCISQIYCRPFDARQLRKLILLRHSSSGIRFTINKYSEEKYSELRQARMFNRYFDISHGTALTTWLSQIKEVNGQEFSTSLPEAPDTDVLYEIPDDWSVLLSQLLLHKRLNRADLLAMLGLTEPELHQQLEALLRCKLIEEKAPELYVVNLPVQPYLIEVLKHKQLL